MAVYKTTEHLEMHTPLDLGRDQMNCLVKDLEVMRKRSNLIDTRISHVMRGR